MLMRYIMLRGSYVFQRFFFMFISFHSLFFQFTYLLYMSGKDMCMSHVALLFDYFSATCLLLMI